MCLDIAKFSEINKTRDKLFFITLGGLGLLVVIGMWSAIKLVLLTRERMRWILNQE